MGGKQNGENWNSKIERSETHDSSSARSAIRHELIDEAIDVNDDELWLDIGRSLIMVALKDDLSSQVSDHFIDNVPDDVFRQLKQESHSLPQFRAWQRKSDSLEGFSYLRRKRTRK